MQLYLTTCDDSLAATVSTAEVVVDGCSRSQTRTFSATDACGNAADSVSVTATWTEDVTPPVINCLANAVVQCLEDVPAAETVTATDNCDDYVEVICSETDNDGSGCPNDPLIITRTCTATDSCGNTATCTQTITVSDTTPPVIDCPDDAFVDSLADVPAPNPDEVTASDNCGEVTVTWVGDEDNGGLGCEGNPLVITRTYKATDTCGNSATCAQIITLEIPLPDCTITVSDSSVCQYSTGNTASVVPVEGATYLWTIENGEIVGPDDGTSITFTAGDYDVGPTIVHLTVTSAEGCPATCDSEITLEDCKVCETAWGYREDGTCFAGTGNWGWYWTIPARTIPTGGDYDISGTMWAGAAKCDLWRGSAAGGATVTVSATGYSLNLNLNTDCDLKDLHVWVSNSKPQDPNKGFKGYYQTESATFPPNKSLNLDAPIYVAVHTGVCCNSCGDPTVCSFP